MFLASAVVLIASCGGGSDSSEPAAGLDGDVVAVGDAPAPGDGVGSVGDAVEVAAGAPAEADAAACTADRQTLELAIETYEVLNGIPPADQAVLVTDQLIKEPSLRFEVTDGVIAPAPGSPCS